MVHAVSVGLRSISYGFCCWCCYVTAAFRA